MIGLACNCAEEVSGSMIFRRLFIIVTSISFTRGLISGFIPFLHTITPKRELLPEELAIKMAQLHVISSVSLWSLFIIFLLLLYFLCSPSNLGREYRKILITLVLSSSMGLFMGGLIGYILGALYIGKIPHVGGAILCGLSTAMYFFNYSFAGFTIVALSYFRRAKR
jgi:uncharacterized protein YacL